MSRCTHFVRTDTGSFYLQVCDENLFPQHKFALMSDDQTWPGGLGCARSWQIVDPSDVPAEIRESLLEAAHSLYETSAAR
jgi:hypothetical protein